MKVLLILIGVGFVMLCLTLFIIKMTEWSESSNDIKSNIGCWSLITFFVVGSTIITVSSVRSCSNSINRPSSYYRTMYDDLEYVR